MAKEPKATPVTPAKFSADASRTVARADEAELREWHRRNRQVFDAFGVQLAQVIKVALREVGVQFQEVFSRTKGEESFLEKAKRFDDPRAEVHDLVGLRVITYFSGEIDRVEQRLNALFAVDSSMTTDKAINLGPDRLGYRARHFVCKIGPDREQLADWKTFRGIQFEVQVTTVLGHAWSEFEHDRGYKSRGHLPPELERRLNLAAGLLEVADRELDSLARDISKYTAEVAEKIGRGDGALTKIDLNGISLHELLLERLPLSVESGAFRPDSSSPDSSELALSELRAFGIRTLDEVAGLIPASYDKLHSAIISGNTVIGVVRDLMMIADADRYFEEAWRKSWHGWLPDNLVLLRKFDIDTSALRRRYGLFIDNET
jgi:putative GTP pyrophosphokinase